MDIVEKKNPSNYNKEYNIYTKEGLQTTKTTRKRSDALTKDLAREITNSNNNNSETMIHTKRMSVGLGNHMKHNQ